MVGVVEVALTMLVVVSEPAARRRRGERGGCLGGRGVMLALQLESHDDECRYAESQSDPQGPAGTGTLSSRLIWHLIRM